MDEQRLNAYLSLVNALLTCPSGQEGEILSANQELIDAHLVHIMEQVAEKLTVNGDEDSAVFLHNLANKIADLLDNSSATDSEENLIFLLNILQTVSDSDANPQVVYPILHANLDKLNAQLVAVLQTWGTTVLTEINANKTEFLASILCNLGNLMQQFPSGNKADNLEIAIAAYEVAMYAFKRECYPQEWANCQINLGIAYIYRIVGEKPENIEKAIEAFLSALTVFNREAFAIYWAASKLNLGRAYYKRIRGKKAANLEQAIACYQAVLQVYSHESFPEQWANLQNSLANAYSDRIMGHRAENLEQAITCYQSALRVYTLEAFPEQWATTQNNLGAVYNSRILGERLENLEQAIDSYQNALLIRTHEAFPQEWAATQNNLATFYNNRIQGDKSENLEMAICCYQSALQVYTREAFPYDWAMIQNNLGNAYSNRIQGDKAENWEIALPCYLQALEVRTRDQFPENWAATQNNLGNAYSNRLNGERAENLETAIHCYELALQEYTRDQFPQDWAATQNNLGNAYSNRLRGDKTDNLERAIHCWRAALEIHTPTTFPRDCLRVGRNLGNAAFTAGWWEIAIEGYKQVIDAVEESRTQAMSDNRRQEIIAEAVGIYNNIVQAYINLGRIDKAIEYVERSRSKRLVDLMASNDLYAGGQIPLQVQKYLQQHEELQAQIDAERERLIRRYDSSQQQTDKSTVALTRTVVEAATATIAKLEAQKQQIWEKMRRLDPVLVGQIQVISLDFRTIQQLIDQPQTAILNFFTTDNDTHIFIIYKDKSPQLHTCIGFGYQTLRDLVVEEWLIPYFNKNQDSIWYETIFAFLGRLAEKMQLNTLVQTYLKGIEELIIIPHLFWHQIPFAALPLTVPTQVNSQPQQNKSSGMMRQVIEIFTRLDKKKTSTSISMSPESETISTQYLGDKFHIRYVPSSQILQYCQQRPQLSAINYGIVENADGTLLGAAFEGEKIAKIYNIPDNQRLQGKERATITNFKLLAKQVQVLHLSHHAISRLDNPLESRLILGDGCITLGQLLTPGWRLPNLSDVFLSCCETNLGISSITDDILTIATGFLCVGARSVVSTLWAVDDLATALFSIFYYQYRQQGFNRTEALQQAQIKLRTLSGKNLAIEYEGELNTYFKQQLEKVDINRQNAAKNCKNLVTETPDYQHSSEDYKYWNEIYFRIIKIKDNLKKLCREELPFAEPYYWAAFIYSGLR